MLCRWVISNDADGDYDSNIYRVLVLVVDIGLYVLFINILDFYVTVVKIV